MLALLVSMTRLAAAQEGPAPVTVQKGPYKATCQFGPADAKPVSFGTTVGTNSRRAITSVPRVLQMAGLKARSNTPSTWDVAVTTTWPSTPETAALLKEPHPGVYAHLVLLTKSDSVYVYGDVEAICAASPTAPDTTVQLAQHLLASQIQDALNTLK